MLHFITLLLPFPANLENAQKKHPGKVFFSGVLTGRILLGAKALIR
jgi:hypothetical protein